jgi:metal-dependent amidase/aminoacylase/carboxypeptidase family protein
VDTTTGEIGLADNAVPDPAEVTITIRSRYPQSPEQRRADLDDQLAKQIITPRDYRILARKHNLDLPVANDAEWNNYCQSVYNNIKLFGDGSTSSGDYEVRDNELHEIHLERLLAFMSRTEFQFASEDVTRAFEQAVTARRERLGILPEPLAYPEDAAAEMQMQMGQMGGPGGPGPMGPSPQGPQGLPPELMGGPGMPMPPQPPPVQ